MYDNLIYTFLADNLIYQNFFLGDNLMYDNLMYTVFSDNLIYDNLITIT